VRRTEVTDKESRSWADARIAKPARIALDLLLRLSPRKRGWTRRLRIGVPDLDAFLRVFKVPERILDHEFYGRRNRGIRLARHALQLADPRAESLPESELRVVMVIAGFNPKPQYKVYKGQQFLARLDLGIDECQVGVEYDGRRWHETSEQVIHDRERRQRLEAEGWVFVIVTAEQLATDYEGILERIRVAMRAQLAR
jgi:very-short-patch-repair endonuclease